MSRRAFHEQSWCTTCQDPSLSCNGDHSSDPIGTPLLGSLWNTTDFGSEFGRLDVFTAWEEIPGTTRPAPEIYVGAVEPAIFSQEKQVVQGYLSIELAERLRDSLDTAIGHAKLTLSANHHMLCDCGDEHD